MIESGRVPGKGRVRTSIEELSQRVPKNCPKEYRKIVESGYVPKIIESGQVQRKGRIRAISEKLSEPVPKNGRIKVIPENDRIRASTGKR